MSILILAEQKNGKVIKAALGALNAGAKIAAKLGVPFHILTLGPDAANAAGQVSSLGAGRVLFAEDPALDNYLDETYAEVTAAAARALGASFVLGVATTQGKAVLPMVAAKLDAGMASDVIAITDALTFVRPIYAGNLNAEVEITTPIKVASLRGTSFEPIAAGAASLVEPFAVALNTAALRKRFVKFDEVVSARPPLTEAAIVVSAGRGVKGPENLPIVEKLADLLGGAVGASRAVVDAGWLPNDYQVGQTGKVVAPQFYFALGLSGAIQHLAGMKDSKVIVAVNKDEEAPIFSVADYGMVGDLFAVVPELTEKLKAAKGV